MKSFISWTDFWRHHRWRKAQ